jgi:hypothetical protein
MLLPVLPTNYEDVLLEIQASGVTSSMVLPVHLMKKASLPRRVQSFMLQL